MTTNPIPDAAVERGVTDLLESDAMTGNDESPTHYIVDAENVEYLVTTVLTAALPLLSVPEAGAVERLRAMVRDEADAHGMTLLKLDKAVAQVERVRALADTLRRRAAKADDDGWRETVLLETATHITTALAARTPDDDAESKSATPERSTIGKGIARMVEPCLYCGNPVVSGDAVARSGPSDHWSHEDCYDTEHDAEGKS